MTPEQRREARAFIRDNLPLAEVPGTGLRLHLAHPRSGLARLVPPGETPYWAHAWPGGVALAMHLRAHPELVRDRIVVDLGAGSGLAGIAASRAGARDVNGLDTDPLADLATSLNAWANAAADVGTWVLPPEHVAGSAIDHVRLGQAGTFLAGDVFYDEPLAATMSAVLDYAAARGVTVLVGDIGRRFLPRDRLEPLASYPVRDVGDPPSAPLREGRVFRWIP